MPRLVTPKITGGEHQRKSRRGRQWRALSRARRQRWARHLGVLRWRAVEPKTFLALGWCPGRRQWAVAQRPWAAPRPCSSRRPGTPISRTANVGAQSVTGPWLNGRRAVATPNGLVGDAQGDFEPGFRPHFLRQQPRSRWRLELSAVQWSTLDWAGAPQTARLASYVTGQPPVRVDRSHGPAWRVDSPWRTRPAREPSRGPRGRARTACLCSVCLRITSPFCNGYSEKRRTTSDRRILGT